MFNSSLAAEMEAYLELRAKTFTDHSVECTRLALRMLDQHLCCRGFQGKHLTEVVLNEWIATLTGKSKTIQNKVSDVRGFVKYLNVLGFDSLLPDAPRVKYDYIPYIYSGDEVKRIFRYADNLTGKNPDDSRSSFKLIVPMVLRILYGCKTRLEETISLCRKDIDFKNGTIFLRNTKYSKERVIPVHETILSILERYCLAMGVMQNPEAYLFPGQKEGTHYCKRQMAKWFAEILKMADIDQREKASHERGACLHCFRHLFVLKAIQQLEEAGHYVDLNDLLLPTYLGHEHLLDTDKYMRFSGVQVPESLSAFETFSAGLIPNVEVSDEEA